MIIDYNKSKNITEEERLVSLRDSVQRALDELTEKIASVEVPNEQTLAERVEVVAQKTSRVRKETAESVQYVKDLMAGNISANNIIADNAVIENLDANYAKINAANITSLTARNAWVQQILIQTGLIANDADVFTLDAIQVNAANITAGTINVDRLIVTYQNQKYLVQIDPQTEQPTYVKMDGDVIGDHTITADKIVAHSITASEITTQNLVGTNGWINLAAGVFAYWNDEEGSGIVWDGEHLTISAQTITMGNVNIAEAISSAEDAVADMQERMDSGEFKGDTAQWYYGTALTHSSGTATLSTSSTSGVVVGAMYLNTSTQNVYKCTAISGTTATWAYSSNIKGAKGDDGTASKWYYGNKITGTSTTATIFSGSGITSAVVGDMYLNTETSAMYQCTVAGSASVAKWVYVGTVTDSIEIGGRNLHKDSELIGSSWTVQNGTNSSGTVTLNRVNSETRIYQMPANGHWTWEANTTYVASIEAKASTAGYKLQFLCNGSNSVTYVSGREPSLTTEWKRYNCVFTTGSSATTGSMSYLSITNNSTIQVRLPKLEKGNKATDWTPAPEETEEIAQTALAQSSEFIAGTQTASTRFWTGTSSSISALTDGLQITYWLPYASKSETASSKSITASELVPTETVTSSSSNSWLKLTLSDGTTTAWLPVYYGGTTRLTTHYGANNAIHLTYKTGVSSSIPAGWWADSNYYVDTYENRVTYFGGKTGAKGIWATSLFMEDASGTYQNICTASNGTATTSNRTAGTTKIANTNGFKVGSPVWYTNTSYNTDTKISGSGVVYSSMSLFDSRYAFNTMTGTTSAGTTGLTVYKPLYLVGTINATDGLFYLDSTWWTQTPTDTSKVYILVGAVVDIYGSGSAYYYRIVLYEKNPWYVYNGTRLVEFNKYRSDEAAKVATNYLSFGQNTGLDVGASGLSSKVNIKSDGVRIYDGNGNLGNYVGAGGMAVYQDEQSVAVFGGESRIGLANSSRLVLSPTEMKMINASSSTVFKINESGETETQVRSYDCFAVADSTVTVTSTTAVSIPSLNATANQISNIENDTKFYIYVNFSTWDPTPLPSGQAIEISQLFSGRCGGSWFEFTKKSSGSVQSVTIDNIGIGPAFSLINESITYDFRANVTVSYTPSTNLISVSGTIRKSDSNSDNKTFYVSIDGLESSATLPVPTTYINGSVYLNSYERDGVCLTGVGNTYIGNRLWLNLDEENEDAELYGLLVDLDWYDDVCSSEPSPEP